MSIVVAVVIGLDPVSLVMDVEVYQRGACSDWTVAVWSVRARSR